MGAAAIARGGADGTYRPQSRSRVSRFDSEDAAQGLGRARFERCGRREQYRDQTRPTSLMRSANATAAVAVEVFVELNVVAKLRVFLVLGLVAQHGPATTFVAQENPREP